VRNLTQADHFFIDGTWARSSGTEQVPAVEAATGVAMGWAAIGGPVDVDLAVRAARAALDQSAWGRSSPGERAAVMRRMADVLERHGATTAELCSREVGMPITTSRPFNGTAPATLLRYYADLAERIPVEEERPTVRGSALVRREPVGVVGAITPWNFPQTAVMFKLGPALAVGCTFVLKHSPDAPLDAYVLGEAATEAGLPAGVLNIVLGGAEAGQALVTHPEVDKIAFTGSTATGRWIGEQCGRLVRRATLELGGKSAAIVCDDADLDVLRQALPNASFRNNSQTCSTQSRILAPRSRYDEVVEAVAQVARDLVVGNPLDERTTLGPMATAHHLEKVLGYIDVARASDAQLVVGGGRPAGLDKGWFVEPTVFAGVDNGDRLAREEVFGPVIAVIPYVDDADAVRIANDNDYGLGGSVWSRDADRALDIARRVRTGTIGFNHYQIDFGSPFGGYKASGVGASSARRVWTRTSS
jgi:aldehyde dehydrogenase (NAD+)